MLYHRGLEQCAVETPAKEALVFGQTRLTFGQLNERANRLANGLRSLGLDKGDRVAVFLPNSVEAFETILALGKAGLVRVPINHRFVGREVEHIVNHSESKAIILDSGLMETIDSSRKNMPKLQKYVVVSGDSRPYIGISYMALMEGSPVLNPAVPVEESDPKAIMYTSGTTGFPKAVLVPHGTQWSRMDESRLPRITCQDVGLVTGPLCHESHGNIGPSVVYHGGTVILMSSFGDGEEALRLIDREKVTFCFAVPTGWQRIVQLPEQTRKKYDLSSMRFIRVSGSPMHVEIKLQVLEMFSNAEVHETYGALEIGVCLHLDLKRERAKINSVGRQSFGAEVKLLGEDCKDVACGEVGTLYVRNPGAGFYGDPQATAKQRVGEWFTANDRFWRDEDGYYYVVDRAQDMVICGGENVYPAEIEAVLAACPAIREVAVIGIPDDAWGEALAAVVVLKSDQKVTGEEIIAFCKGKLAGYKKPKVVEFRDELPHNEMGKILKRQLREKYWHGRKTQVW